MRAADFLGVLVVLILIAGCSVTPGECAAGFVLENGFCVRITCAPGQRIVDNACVPIECPPGTTLQSDDTCGSDDTTTPITEATPPGGLYSGTVTVTLTANEPAVVFYTTDGSTPTDASSNGPSPLRVDIAASGDLRFFSVDPAGNAESPLTEEYTIDDGPDGVTDLTATPTPGGVDLAWTNPSDPLFVGVLVARGRGLTPSWTPENLVEYEVGDIVGPDIVIAAAGNFDSVTDDEPWGDLNGYSVWARDEAFNYSADVATVELPVRYPPQAFEVTIDLINETASIDQQPRDAYIELAPQISESKTFVQIGIRVTNKAARPLYNLKAVVDPPSAGLSFGEGVYEGDQAYYFGPNAVAPGERSGSKDVNVILIPGGTPTLTVPIRIVSHPLMVLGAWRTAHQGIVLADPTDTGFRFTGAAPFFTGYPASPNQPTGGGNFHTAAVSPDGLRLYGGHNNTATVTVVDLTTITPTLSAELGGPGTPPVAQTAVALSPDGEFLYVVLTTATHGRQYGATPFARPVEGPIDIQVVKLDAMTLAEVDRQDLMMDLVNDFGTAGRAQAIDVSSDGTRLAVGVDDRGQLFYLDASNLDILFQKSVTNPRVTSVKISPGNTHVYLVGRNFADMSRVDTTTEVETVVPSGYTGGEFAGMLEFGPDGMLYVTRQLCTGCAAGASYGTLAKIDPSNLNVTQNGLFDTRLSGLGFQGPLLFAQERSGGLVRVFNAATLAQIGTFPGNNGGHIAYMTPSPLWTP